MAAQTVFSVEMFPVGVSMMEDGQSLSDMPRNTLPAPQLVMLANVAAVTASEGGGGGGGEGSAADEKEMMELKTVGCSYSDSEDESIIRYSYDNQNHREVCIIEYPESPGPGIHAVIVGNDTEEEGEGGGDKAEDLSHRAQPRPSAATKTPEQGLKHKDSPAAATERTKKKKPFHCKPCHFQAQNEQEFVEHLGTHGISKMMVVNRVEGRSKTKAKEAETPESPAPSGGEMESSGEVGAAGTAGDIKGLIRCERCGYNTNRYDHYIAHLKHHSKEGEDHRVFKCTLCPYTTVSQYHWRKHLRNHFPSKLHTCSQCSYFSDRKSNYIQHIRTHTGVRPFRCLYCDYSSSQKTHLTRHMRTHSGERPFKCESCNYLAANQHEVTRHARQVHNGPKPLSCPYCEYKTADRSNFKKHVELHLNPRQFLCPLCKYAASKKCNLQYHIKSRHSGCNVAVDISKVKLRVKKPGPDGAEENSRASKLDNSSSVEEDFDMDEDDGDEGVDSSPINLSIRKSSRPSIAQPGQSEAPDKAPKKSSVSSEKEKLSKVKDKVEPERKVTTRQKKIEKANENLLENASVKQTKTETVTAAVNTDNKVKRRVKNLPAEKTAVQDQAAVTASEQDQKQTEKSDQQRSDEERVVRQKEEEKLRPEKEKEHQKNDSSGKENKSVNRSRKSGSKKSEKLPEHVEEAQQKPDSPKKIQKEKVVKEKAAKRKAAEALDLSKRSSSETPSKARRLKATAAENLHLKPASEDTKKINGATPTLHKSNGTTPVKQKKTRNASKKAGLQQTVDPPKDKTTRPSTDAPEGSDQPDNPTQTTDSEHRPTENSPAQKKASTDETTPAAPEKTLNKPSEKMEVSPTCGSGEDTPSPADDHPAPTFVKPTSPPSLVLPGQRSKPADPEDDEGIHSSHEGGSDISDSASEGSDDSGLNGNGAGSGKMANDPETPTDEIPTPTELKSHMCIFCDRTFPLEVEYRRHLNRHLVNVYYMDNTAKGQK
ncbi:RE1-silencing transcription factor [Siniperca chuatsi]|uniref:RE1-silencing transcription factor n=1 Tax=Siniperca chuatsi TaxID=119488 RepID=UPI001CE0BC95|nr:RE1-silencing transcription factor [Siniperca chuatsi]XP_044061676.1 RE1-silencing transcription factor [Siniperca chuatsi]XP_044061677.1 RE1-silencing transcription factor [Siniperca chuatsi]